ncbi:MAG: HAD family phosphatase [Anaerolineae bacterium]|nr:HAD family phosphatase [Anaerolineae bacterium]
MPIRAVIFDMEGVLMDSEVYWRACREDFARDLGKLWTLDDQQHAMGRNTVEWARVMQERLGIAMPVQDIIDDMIRRVIARYDERLPLRPGALEAVRLAAAHYRVGLASGSPTPVIQVAMQRSGLDRAFQVMVYGDDIPRGKPAPDIYQEALRQLGVAAEEAVGIEDSANGVRALKAAGMWAIAAPSPGFDLPDDVQALADRLIDSLEEFSLDLVRGLTD